MSSFITRTERSGNIFFRVTGLIRAGQLKWNERPLWYDVYAASPPITPPDWNVKLPKSDEPVRSIFYDEDIIRAKFYKNYKTRATISVESLKESVSQMFIKEYNTVKQEEAGETSEEELFSKTETRLKDAGIQLQ
ncbi:unnamed protein product [Caenorhabditis auriculariae]|uniref:Small ribosomal subunit protein mS23 n=1 Tax=Caenorhabditis auriculariae TaxID=2777116 RepID=A0A8S1GYW9_9PELO|nr:unnamed protein product [Caenorhabditis auriculariae]